jgi:Protein of unknwon function (DUF3008)
MEAQMPAASKAQQRAAGAALSAKRGETSVNDLFGASKEMFECMTEAELEELAQTKTANLPEHKNFRLTGTKRGSDCFICATQWTRPPGRMFKRQRSESCFQEQVS